MGYRRMLKSTWWRDQRGITGIETAIILIAFVVVASVFSFAILSTGLLSAEKSGETVLGGLEETGATIAMRGSVIGHATSTGVSGAWLDYVQFQISNASQSGNAVSLASDDVVVTYFDSEQSVNLRTVPLATIKQGWNAVWISGSSPILNPGERAEINRGSSKLEHASWGRHQVYDRDKAECRRRDGRETTIPAEITTATHLQ